MALAEIDIATEIVIIGFTSIIITLGIIAVMVVLLGGKSYLDKLFNKI